MKTYSNADLKFHQEIVLFSLTRTGKHKQKGFRQKAFFRGYGGKKRKKEKKKATLHVLLYQDSNRETDYRNLIQLELNRTSAGRCSLLCPL